MTTLEIEGYEVDDDPSRVDFEAVWHFLSTEAYWSKWRTRDDVERQVRGAWRVVGVYEKSSGAQVGFARALSDGVSEAYLADVYIGPGHRGRGLSKRLLSLMCDELPGKNFRWFLSTRDGHGLYEQFGFGPPNDRVMVRPDAFPPSG